MLRSIALALAFTAVGLAADPGFPIFCNQEHDQYCIQRLDDSCYNCIQSIETTCPGDENSDEFKNCFCNPAKLDIFAKCIPDPVAQCAYGPNTFLLGPWNLECSDYNKKQCASYDADTGKISMLLCGDAPVSANGSPSSAPATVKAPTASITGQPHTASVAAPTPSQANSSAPVVPVGAGSRPVVAAAMLVAAAAFAV